MTFGPRERSTALCATIEQGHWRVGIGDPTLEAWLAVAAYAMAGAVAIACAKRHAGARVALRRFWWLVGMAMLLLAVNKQLDFQELLTQFARDSAQAQGWYDAREPVKRAAIAVLAAAGLAGVATAAWILRREARALWPALVGLSMLALFVAARATSVEGVDALLSSGSPRVRWVLEFGGSLLVGVNAAWCWRRERVLSSG